MFLTSCEDILGKWDKPTPVNVIVTPDDGGTTTSNTYIKYTAPGTKTNEPIGDATKWEYTANADVPAGTYYVEGTVNCAGKITLTGDVNLILKDGSKLTITEGITYTSGTPSLKIFAQSTDPTTMGSLVVGYTTATDGDDTPAVRVKGLEIHGGKIEATGYFGSAATYCCYGLEVLGGKFIMYDGDVTATGKTSYPGIVSDDPGCSIEIEGGTLTANGGDAPAGDTNGGAGIYGSGSININGGTVNANGGNGALGTTDNGGHGIFVNFSGSITINGGAVNVKGGDGNGSAGYGLNSGGTGTIAINGGTIIATSTGTKGVGISGSGDISLTGSTTSVKATGTMYGIRGLATIICDGATVFGKATGDGAGCHGIRGEVSYVSGVIEGEGGSKPLLSWGFWGNITNNSGSDKTLGYKGDAANDWSEVVVTAGDNNTTYSRYMIMPKP